MYNANSGYYGYSMSLRACEAYDNGEMPYSKWTKKTILDRLDYFDIDSSIFKKYSAEALKSVLLHKSSWHHTSKMFNRTNFYNISSYEIKKGLKDILEALENYTPTEKKDGLIIVKIRYTENTAPRFKKPKYETFVRLGLKKGGSVYTIEKIKRLSGSHIEILEEFKRCPRGEASTIKQIKKTYNL